MAAVGALVVARVVRAESKALAPVTLRPEPGDELAIIVFGAETESTGPSDELA